MENTPKNIFPAYSSNLQWLVTQVFFMFSGLQWIYNSLLCLVSSWTPVTFYHEHNHAARSSTSDCTGAVRNHIREKKLKWLAGLIGKECQKVSSICMTELFQWLKKSGWHDKLWFWEVMDFASWVFHTQRKKISYVYTELRKGTMSCLQTKQRGGSDRSLKGFDDNLIKMNDATPSGGLNNILEKVACDMKGGVASVSEWIGIKRKKIWKIFPEISYGNRVLYKHFRTEFQRYCK